MVKFLSVQNCWCCSFSDCMSSPCFLIWAWFVGVGISILCPQLLRLCFCSSRTWKKRFTLIIQINTYNILHIFSNLFQVFIVVVLLLIIYNWYDVNRLLMKQDFSFFLKLIEIEIFLWIFILGDKHKQICVLKQHGFFG